MLIINWYQSQKNAIKHSMCISESILIHFEPYCRYIWSKRFKENLSRSFSLVIIEVKTAVNLLLDRD